MIIFKRTAVGKGNSLGVTIPPEIIEYLELKEGDEISMIAEEGKHGCYASFWCTKQQAKFQKEQTKLKE